MNKNNKWQSVATLYLTWFLVTAIGFTILVYLGDLIAERISYTSRAEFLGALMIWIVTSFICGGVWGFLQSRLMQLSAGHMISWVFVSAFNMVANRIIIYTVEEENLNLILTITVARKILGIIQFFILRKKTFEAVWWIPASILALAMSYVIGIQIHAYSERLLVITVAAINGLVTGIPFVISFSKFKLWLVEKFTLVTFSAFLIASIWLPASAGLTAPDSTITTSDRTFEFEFSPDGKIVAMVDPITTSIFEPQMDGE